MSTCSVGDLIIDRQIRPQQLYIFLCRTSYGEVLRIFYPELDHGTVGLAPAIIVFDGAEIRFLVGYWTENLTSVSLISSCQD